MDNDSDESEEDVTVLLLLLLLLLLLVLTPLLSALDDEFDLLFNPSLLAATGVVEGGFLLDPVFVAPPPGTQIDNSAGSVEMAAATLLPIGASGSGVLASIGFDTLAVGTSVLDLDNVLLSAPFGVPIEFEGLQDGSVEITPGTAVPEPLIPALLAGGLLASLLLDTPAGPSIVATAAALFLVGQIRPAA